MTGDTTVVAGIEIPSADPVFLAIVAVHVALGVACVVAGAVAMLAPKREGRHPRFGTIYFWCLAAVFATACLLSIVRWNEDLHLLLLGALAFAAALFGRSARRLRWANWAPWHIGGMGLSYVVMLTAFYVDNGRQLPLWKELPPWTYWTLPALVGVPIIAWAMLRHPLARQSRR